MLTLEAGNSLDILRPASWAQPRGYSNGIVARGRIVFIAGQIGWDEARRFDSDELVGQTRQALLNVLAVLREAGGAPEHVVRMNWYIVDRDCYKAAAQEIGLVYRELMGRHYPAMTCVEVKGLIEDQALVEIEATAVLPD